MAEKKTMSIDEAFGSLDDQSAPPTTPPPQPSLLQRAGTMASDLGKGVGESAVDLMSTGDEFARKHLPAFLTNSNLGFGPPADLQHVHDLATPANTPQAVGKLAGNAAQFLIPGGAEDALASAAPKVLRPMARIGASALGSGAVNAEQGGSFGTGAAVGAGGGAVAEGLRALAPAMAETALRVRGNQRLFGRTVGDAILNDTKGVRPDRIARSAGDTISQLSPELDAADQASAARGEVGSLAPARTKVAQVIGGHNANRAVNTAADLQPIANFLDRDALTGLRLAPAQSAPALRALKRGLNEDFIGKWSPDQPPAQKGTARQAYGMLNDELHRLSPETADIDQRISSLIPVRQQGDRVASQAPMAQKVMGRVAAHSGAMLGAGGGAGIGYHEGGLPGAIVGGLGGLVLPELATTPEAEMIAARTMHAGGGPLRPLALGVGMGIPRFNSGRTKETGDLPQ